MITSALVVAPPATALPAADAASASRQLSEIDIDQALAELRAAGLVTSERPERDGSRIQVDLGEGLSFELFAGSRAGRLGGGYDAGGSYVLFNQFDQAMLYNGTGFLLGAAICAIPAIGQVACLAVQAIIAVASAAVAAQKGTCKNNKQLKVYFSNNHASRSGCV
ncbi:hypothetical protein [Curtobacterium sp. 314Chir4.1]|uniref:hypothetical protein n=1 Tax=Curtobacterium sp. 314Chir4.1 TaxID=1279028 RepID=UPI001C3EEC2E|nr:hypothetical protein [Curtobacterium sp. 314Chir4.1]